MDTLTNMQIWNWQDDADAEPAVWFSRLYGMKSIEKGFCHD